MPDRESEAPGRQSQAGDANSRLLSRRRGTKRPNRHRSRSACTRESDCRLHVAKNFNHRPWPKCRALGRKWRMLANASDVPVMVSRQLPTHGNGQTDSRMTKSSLSQPVHMREKVSPSSIVRGDADLEECRADLCRRRGLRLAGRRGAGWRIRSRGLRSKECQ